MVVVVMIEMWVMLVVVMVFMIDLEGVMVMALKTVFVMIPFAEVCRQIILNSSLLNRKKGIRLFRLLFVSPFASPATPHLFLRPSPN